MDADLASFGHWFSVCLVHVWKMPVSGKDVKQRSTLALDTMCSSARTSYGSFTAPLAMTTMLLPWLHVSSSPGSIRWMISIHSSYFWIPELIWFRVTCPNKLISNTQATVGWPEYIHSYWWTYRWSALVYQTVGTTALRKHRRKQKHCQWLVCLGDRWIWHTLSYGFIFEQTTEKKGDHPLASRASRDRRSYQ